jgi:hypothetical protein
MNMGPISNGFRYLAHIILNLARNIFIPSHRNAPMSEACESVCSVSWLLWLLIERAKGKYCATNIGNRSEYYDLPEYWPFLLGHPV